MMYSSERKLTSRRISAELYSRRYNSYLKSSLTLMEMVCTVTTKFYVVKLRGCRYRLILVCSTVKFSWQDANIWPPSCVAHSCHTLTEEMSDALKMYTFTYYPVLLLPRSYRTKGSAPFPQQWRCSPRARYRTLPRATLELTTLNGTQLLAILLPPALRGDH